MEENDMASERRRLVHDDLIAAGWTDAETTSFSDCKEITPEMARALINAWDGVEPDHGLCRGEFWCRETFNAKDVWFTIDNTTGDCWTEEFATEDAAKGYLLYGLCAEDAYSIDGGTYTLDYLIRCTLQDEAELDDFDPANAVSPDPQMERYKKPFENQWEQGKLDAADLNADKVMAVNHALQFPGPQIVLPEGTDLAEWLENPSNLAAAKEKAKEAIDRATIHEIDCFDSFAEPVPANELDAPIPTPTTDEKAAMPSSDKATYVAQLPAKAQEAIYQKLVSRFEDEGFEPDAAARFAQTGMDSKICDLEEVIPRSEVDALCAKTAAAPATRSIGDAIAASQGQAHAADGDHQAGQPARKETER